MIYTNPKLNEKLEGLLQEKYGFDEEVLRALRQSYLTSVMTIIFNQTAHYYKGKPEEEKLNSLTEHQGKSQAEMMDQGMKLSKFVFDAYSRIPELQEVIDEKIQILKDDILKTFIKRLEVEELNEFLEAVKKEAELGKEIEKILQQHSLEI